MSHFLKYSEEEKKICTPYENNNKKCQGNCKRGAANSIKSRSQKQTNHERLRHRSHDAFPPFAGSLRVLQALSSSVVVFVVYIHKKFCNEHVLGWSAVSNLRSYRV